MLDSFIIITINCCKVCNLKVKLAWETFRVSIAHSCNLGFRVSGDHAVITGLYVNSTREILFVYAVSSLPLLTGWKHACKWHENLAGWFIVVLS